MDYIRNSGYIILSEFPTWLLKVYTYTYIHTYVNKREAMAAGDVAAAAAGL